MRNFYLTAWSERVIQTGDAHSNGSPVMETTVEWASDIQHRPEDQSTPFVVSGTLRWTAPRTPNVSPADRTDWVKKLLRSSL
ncbi:hypothetical protein AAJCM20276_27410 [Acetobacter aceti]|uniref:Uncharacterized protein n=1 Tax=Acetobacter aceti TaxID=435 RepID=A0A6S6PGI1_ACEAC|nr:hypothetical protein AAJCM20276_27410 [Acetobacter aceti]